MADDNPWHAAPVDEFDEVAEVAEVAERFGVDVLAGLDRRRVRCPVGASRAHP